MASMYNKKSEVERKPFERIEINKKPQIDTSNLPKMDKQITDLIEQNTHLTEKVRTLKQTVDHLVREMLTLKNELKNKVNKR